MKRRNFIGNLALGGGALVTAPLIGNAASPSTPGNIDKDAKELSADLVIAGGGMGSCAAALAALRNNLRVIITEETDWLGGQVTQQGVPLDEHQWIETHGGTQLYRDFRTAIRQYYIRHYPLTDEARTRKNLNIGDGNVSRLCCEPHVVVAVLNELFAPYIGNRKLTILMNYRITGADVTGDKVRALKAISTKGLKELVLTAPYFIDGTELGELLPLTGTEYVTGTESRSETKELHAPEKGDPKNEQAFTICFAIDNIEGANNVIDKPREYDFWRNYQPAVSPAWPGKLFQLSYSNPRTLEPRQLDFNPDANKTGPAFNIWNYRRIINKNNFKPGAYESDITIVNWPQNDYLLGRLVDVKEQELRKHIDRAKQLSLSLFYWLQTEAPRSDGKQGWPGLRLRGDIMGTQDGMAMYPYVREARRIKSVFTILEEHVGEENRALVAGKNTGTKGADFFDSVGIGFFRIDLHPTTMGNNYIDIAGTNFQIPLGALLPRRMQNLVAANKNIGTTHITNGCYRLHHVEWNIGEAAGSLIAYAVDKKTTPHAVREKKDLLEGLQTFIRKQGIETQWPV